MSQKKECNHREDSEQDTLIASALSSDELNLVSNKPVGLKGVGFVELRVLSETLLWLLGWWASSDKRPGMFRNSCF